MGTFKNPWGKSTDGHDKWFGNRWSPDSASATDEFPIVDHWEIKNQGIVSSDNKSALAAQASLLGLDADPTGWSNGIEFKVFIRDHTPGFSYDMKRVKQWVIWEKIGNEWKKTSDFSTKSSDDNSNTDEYLIPQLDQASGLYYIYSMDRPGIGGQHFWTKGASIFCLTANFEESVSITRDLDKEEVNDPTTQMWYCRIYLNVTEQERSMNKQKSFIGSGQGSLEQPTD